MTPQASASSSLIFLFFRPEALLLTNFLPQIRMPSLGPEPLTPSTQNPSTKAFCHPSLELSALGILLTHSPPACCQPQATPAGRLLW